MRTITILLSFFIFSTSFAKEKQLKKYIKSIDKSINEAPDIHLNSKIGDEYVYIKGWMRNDTVVKAKIFFLRSNRERIVYFRDINFFPTNVCYIQEIDNSSKKTTVEIQLWDDQILSSTVDSIKTQEIAFQSDYQIPLTHKRIDDQAKKYFLRGRLEQLESLSSGCGYFAFATIFKMRTLYTTYRTDDDFILVILPCPREYGKDFFRVGEVYDLDLASNNGVSFDFTISNEERYAKDLLPRFWIRKIERFNSQKRNMPRDTASIYNSCETISDTISIEPSPDIHAKPVNSMDISGKIMKTPEVQLMREAGILSCSVEIDYQVGQYGEILCYNLRSDCHPIWDRAIIRYIPSIQFESAQKDTKPVNSWTIVHLSWRFEW